MACISGDFEGKTKFDVALHFTEYLRQLLSDFQNLKTARARKYRVGTYVLSSEEVKRNMIHAYSTAFHFLQVDSRYKW